MRLWMRALLGLGLITAPAAPGWAATDFKTMQPPEIEALQKRLTDAGCYHGAVDGKAGAATAAAVQACPDQAPVLRIETGMHTKGISTMDTDAACQTVVTGSDDKTVRLWSLPNGDLLDTIRIPISNSDAGDDPLGSVTAVAVSPDARVIAVIAFKNAGPHTDRDLYVVDVKSHVRWHKVLQSTVENIAFSPDGKRVTLLDQNVQIYDVKTGGMIQSYQLGGNQNETGFTIDSYGNSYAFDGRTIYRFDAISSARSKKTLAGKDVAFNYLLASPNGRYLAASVLDRMTILESSTLGIIAEFDLPSSTSIFSWNADSESLFVSSSSNEDGMVRRLTLDGKRVGRDLVLKQHTISKMKTCSKDIIFATAEGDFGTMGQGLNYRFLQRLPTYSFSFQSSSMSDDLNTGLFALLKNINRSFLFDIKNDSLYEVDTKKFSFSKTVSTDGGYFLSKNGNVLVDESGGIITWRLQTDDEATSNRALLRLFVDPKSKGWVAWTPTGYYMASPGAGEDLIGWHINRGWAQEADFFPASRFRDRFNRPDVVRAVLTTLDEGEALRQADEVAHRRPEDAKPLIERLPPVVAILSPAAGASVPPGPVDLHYSVRLPSGGALARVEAFVDGAKVEPRGLARPSEAEAEADGTITLPMPAHDASLSLVAYGADGKASDTAVLALKSTGTTPALQALKPTLYALLVGVSHYQDKGYDLGYAAADAHGFAEALKAQEGRLYGHVEVKVLADADATAVGLKRGLSWLRRQTTAHDLAIVFAAGHGTTDARGKFWFLSADMDPSDIDATAVSQDEIAGALYDLPGKKLLFLDACNSGAALDAGKRGATDVSTAVSNFAQAEGGVVAYAASTGREASFERPEWGHGAFTKALIEGFGGGADLVHDGTITTSTLDLFVERRVKELTGGQQHAVMTRPRTVPDFPIALSH